MGTGYKKDGGFDRRTSGGKTLDTAGNIIGGAAIGVYKVGEGVAAAGKFVGKKIGEQQEKAKQKREEKKEEIRNRLQGLREEDPSGYTKTRQWAIFVRELLAIYDELSAWEGSESGNVLDEEKKEEIKIQLNEIKEEDPSGYIKVKRFWYSNKKILNKYFDKEEEKRLKEEHPEIFDKFYKKLKRVYFWYKFEDLLEKYKDKVAKEILKIEDPEAYKSLLFRKKIKLALILTSAILIAVGIGMFSIQECSFDKITDGSAKTADERELNCKAPLF